LPNCQIWQYNKSQVGFLTNFSSDMTGLQLLLCSQEYGLGDGARKSGLI
jgi:hypothetical protein